MNLRLPLFASALAATAACGPAIETSAGDAITGSTTTAIGAGGSLGSSAGGAPAGGGGSSIAVGGASSVTTSSAATTSTTSAGGGGAGGGSATSSTSSTSTGSGSATTLGISAGGDFTCAFGSIVAPQCWGDGANGRLGDGTTSEHRTPIAVRGLAVGAIIAISSAVSHACVLTHLGGVVCWGTNSNGELGNGTHTDSADPVPVQTLGSGVTAISAGGGHTCAITTQADVLCWGQNSFGELGDGTMASRTIPVAVRGLSGPAVAIASGGDFSCALTSAGAVQCWGWNFSGELGDGTGYPSALPVGVHGLSSKVVAITAGQTHACALTTLGAVKCWGDNASGDVGDGTLIQRLAPVAVSTLSSDVVALSAGREHTCALTNAGAALCWGDGTSGALGDGGTSAKTKPVGVRTLSSGVSLLSAGDTHTCAVLTTGEAKCWGKNEDGELGDGTTTPRSVPVDVLHL